MHCTLTAPHCADCGSVHLHEGPNEPPPWCCCEDCGSCDVGDPEQCPTDHGTTYGRTNAEIAENGS